MNDSSLNPIPIPKNLKIQTNIPYWTIKILLKSFYHFVFKKKSFLKINIVNEILKIHNINYKNFKFLNSGRGALLYLFKYFELKEDDIVLIPSFTCRSVLHAVLQFNLKPLLVDIDDEYNINLDSILSYKYLKNVKVLIIPNMFGILNKNLYKIKLLKEKYNIIIIEDNATSFGAKYSYDSLSDAIFFSFNIGKMINGAGGGLALYNSINKNNDKKFILKNNNKYSFILFFKFLIILRFRKIFNFFSIFRKDKKIPSINQTFSKLDFSEVNKKKPIFFKLYNISKINLCLIYNQICEYDKLINHNAKIKKEYIKYFNKLYINKYNFNSNLFILHTSDLNRGQLGQYFSDNGIESYWSYYPLHKIDIYKKLECLENLKNTERIWNSFLYLPVNYSINKKDIHKIYQVYNKFKSNNENEFIFNNYHSDKNLTHKIKNSYDKKYIYNKKRLLNKYIYPNDNVLDLCCGSGEYYQYVKNLNINYYGVDFSSNLLNEFKKKNIISNKFKLINSSAEQLKLKNESIDLCFCFSAIYYIQDVEKIFLEIRRILNKNGIAIIEFATNNNINSFISEYWYKYGIWGKPYFITYNSMINLIKKNNFDIMNESHFQLFPILRGPFKYILFANSLSKYFLHFKIFNKSIDEHISSNIFLKKYSFKHIYVLKKN